MCLTGEPLRFARFADVYDRYSDSSEPTLAFVLQRPFRLTGVINSRGRDLGVGNGYDETGILIDGKIPELSFLARETMRKSTDQRVRTVATYASQSHYVIPNNWPENVSYVSAVQNPSHWPDYPDIKRNSLSFTLPRLGDFGDLFPLDPKAQARGQIAQFYCRQEGLRLLCLVESLTNASGQVTRDSLGTFFIFE